VTRRRHKRSIRESFSTRMNILAYMIEQRRPVTPKEINEALGIDHYPTVNYHLKTLTREGVVIPLRNEGNYYTIQPFMWERKIDPRLEEVVNEAFNNTYIDHFITNSEGNDMEIRITAFNNAFLYYIKYLLETGKFQKS